MLHALLALVAKKTKDRNAILMVAEWKVLKPGVR